MSSSSGVQCYIENALVGAPVSHASIEFISSLVGIVAQTDASGKALLLLPLVSTAQTVTGTLVVAAQGYDSEVIIPYTLKQNGNLIVGIVPTSHPPPPPPPLANAGMIAPMYMPPGAIWNQLIDAKAMYPTNDIIGIMNPNSGPAPSLGQQQVYVSAITALHAAGIKVIGYVATGGTSVSLLTAESYIKDYHDWYNVDGIFFDEMGNTPGQESYYSQLTAYAKSLGMAFTVGNPGTQIPSSFFNTVDILNIYENASLPNLSTIQSRTLGGSRNEFSIMAYGVPTLSSPIIQSYLPYVNYIYITDATSPGQYFVLPSYLNQEASYIAGGTSPPPPPPPPTSGSRKLGVWQQVVDFGMTGTAFANSLFNGTAKFRSLEAIINENFPQEISALNQAATVADGISNAAIEVICVLDPNGTDSGSPFPIASWEAMVNSLKGHPSIVSFGINGERSPGVSSSDYATLGAFVASAGKRFINYYTPQGISVPSNFEAIGHTNYPDVDGAGQPGQLDLYVSAPYVGISNGYLASYTEKDWSQAVVDTVLQHGSSNPATNRQFVNMAYGSPTSSIFQGWVAASPYRKYFL